MSFIRKYEPVPLASGEVSLDTGKIPAVGMKISPLE